MRGKHTPIHKMSESTSIIDHIESYHPSLSHYRRKHAPLRRYFPSGMTVAEVHSTYKEKHPDEKVCYESYRKIFVSMKASFTKLGEEECEVCETFKQDECSKNHYEAEDTDNDEQTCETCKEHENHLEKAKTSREVYRKDASFNTISEEAYFSMDMQKILMLPHLPGIKTVLFTRRIIMINQSIAPLGTFKNKSNKLRGYLWHEAIQG